MANDDVYITTRQLADLISVDTSTIRRWVEAGKLTPAVTTPGGHHRFIQHRALAELGAPALAEEQAS